MKNKQGLLGNDRAGWFFLGLAAVLILGGELARWLAPAVAGLLKWVVALGILCLGVALVYLIRWFHAKKDPVAARRAMLEEDDERARMIRYRAGSYAFCFSIVLTYVVLMVYSVMTASIPGFDVIWFTLAFMVVGPALVYIGSMVYLQQHD